MNVSELDALKSALPVYPGVHGRYRYFNSAVLLPLVAVGDSFHLLFEKRAINIRQGGEICFPGGQHEPETDGSFTETAIRETMEELGVAREQIQIVGVMDTLVAAMGATVDPIVGILSITDLKELSLQEDEVARVFTVPVSWFEQNRPEVYQVRLSMHPEGTDSTGTRREWLPAKALGLPERYHKPWKGKPQPVYVFRYDGEIIWGITAELVLALLDRMGKCPVKFGA